MNVREYFKNNVDNPLTETCEDLMTGKEVMDIAQQCVNEALKRAKNNVVLDLVSKRYAWLRPDGTTTGLFDEQTKEATITKEVREAIEDRGFKLLEF
jgi:hypothetical protein